MSTNLGTAYVSVMPSMKGFGAAVESGLSGIDTTGAGTEMGQRAANGFAGGMAKGGAIMGAASALATKAFDAVASSANRAVARVDTMNNFPKVMANMNIGADDAQAAIDTLSDRLTGLPTALDTAVSSVQRFTMKTNDVGKSTGMFLAVNDAIIAGGTSMSQQASALEQLSQAYAKGKADTMEWRTLQQAMPAQLKQIADSMGMTVEQLGAGLRQAEKDESFLRNVSMDEFVAEIQKLDKEGVNGLASFEEQARTSSGGIQTSMENMETAIVRGVANIIDGIGQENISGVINDLSKGIGEVGKAFASDGKAIGQFISENREEIKSGINTIAEIGPAAVKAWGAVQVFKGGKALFAGFKGGVMSVVGGFDRLTAAGSKVFYVGDGLAEAGKRGSKALKGLGSGMMEAGILISSMTAGSVALAGGLAIGIAALDAYNKSLWEQSAAEYKLSEEQQAAIDRTHTMADSYGKLAEERDAQIACIGREDRLINGLKDSYNALVDENGNVIEGYESQANFILDQLAVAMGVERGQIDALIDEYGKLGDAADEAVEKRKAERLLEVSEPEYNEAVANKDQALQDYASNAAAVEESSKKAAEAQRRLADAQQFALDTLPAEALSIAAYGYGDLAYQATEAGKSLSDAADALKESSDTLEKYESVIANYEGLQAALGKGDADAIGEWSTRLTNNIVKAENGTRESLQAQVDMFRESYDAIAKAVENGDTRLEGSLEEVGAALAIAEDEFARFDSIEIKDKVAKAKIDDGSVIIAQGRVLQWNGTELVDLGSEAEVDVSSLDVASDKVYEWNKGELKPMTSTVKVKVDTSDYDNWTPAQKTAYVEARGPQLYNGIKRFFAASGGFARLHASGGFITDGPMSLGYDAYGVQHIAGEDGSEWFMRHADGTTSILPIQNQKYLKPYASVIADMIGGGRQRSASYNLILNYTGREDPNDIMRAARLGFKRMEMMEA